MSLPEKLPFHPCMDEAAHHKIARIHLPVARKCNITCHYCEKIVSRKAVNKPGLCSGIISPGQALFLAKEFIQKWGETAVIGIAGPGDPLANPETFETLALIHKTIKSARLCLCTNGLLLSESVDILKENGVKHLTVTINGLKPDIVSRIQPSVTLNDKKYVGNSAAKRLIINQVEGIQMAVRSGIFVKINSVAIKGINDYHIPEIAKASAKLGAGVFNIIPLIPGGGFKKKCPPSPQQIDALFSESSAYIKTFRKCKQCRADACGIPGKENRLWKKTA